MWVNQPQPKTWLEILPDEYLKNPSVVVVMAPRTAKVAQTRARDGSVIGVLDVNGTRTGLQVISPQMAVYAAHAQEFTRHGLEMERPVYVGPLLDMPTALLTDDDRVPLVFLRDSMSRPFLNLTAYVRALMKATKRIDVVN